MIYNSYQKSNRFVLIDDDPTYRAIILRAAALEDFEVDVYESLADIGSIGMIQKYDAAIIDCDLGKQNGVEIAAHLSALFENIPIILVSEQERTPDKSAWPVNIKKFIKKSQGYGHALREANKLALVKKLSYTDDYDAIRNFSTSEFYSDDNPHKVESAEMGRPNIFVK